MLRGQASEPVPWVVLRGKIVSEADVPPKVYVSSERPAPPLVRPTVSVVHVKTVETNASVSLPLACSDLVASARHLT